MIYVLPIKCAVGDFRREETGYRAQIFSGSRAHTCSNGFLKVQEEDVPMGPSPVPTCGSQGSVRVSPLNKPLASGGVNSAVCTLRALTQIYVELSKASLIDVAYTDVYFLNRQMVILAIYKTVRK